MNVLFLSSLCSVKEYKRMFDLYKSTSSHASQKFNRLFVQGLVENGCEVETLTQRIILSGGENDLERPSETENSVKYTYLRRYRSKLINRLMTIWNAFRFIRQWTKKHKDGIVICDVIIGELSLALWLASKTRKIKTVALVTDVPSIRAGEQRKGLKALPIKIKNSIIYSYRAFVFLTEQMNKKLNPKKRPYAIIEGLVDKNVLDVSNTLEKKAREKVIFMAGLLEEIYGVEMLLDAFSGSENPQARLVFYGKGSSVEKIIEKSKEDNRISYCGELSNSEIVAKEKEATLLINPRPAIGEWTAYSFPSKNMEYMASGTPLVAFDLPSIPSEYDVFFYHLDEYSQESIRSILNDLLAKSAEELNKFGLDAQKWIVENKNPKIQVKKLLDAVM